MVNDVVPDAQPGAEVAATEASTAAQESVDPRDELPATDAAGKAVTNVDELLAAMLPGFQLRVVLMGQWTDVCVTWRSTNGHFFVFSSEVAGRSHSIGRRGIERLIAKQHVRVPEDSPMAEHRSGRG